MTHPTVPTHVYWVCRQCGDCGAIEYVADQPFSFVIDAVVRGHLVANMACAGLNGALCIDLSFRDWLLAQQNHSYLATEKPS